MEIILISLLTLVASMIGTITGFGTSMIMVPVMAMVLPPLEAIFFVAIIHWFNDAWKALLFRKGLYWKLIVLFGIAGVLGSYIGASLSLGLDPQILLRILGVFLVSYACFLSWQSNFKIPATNSMAAIGGALSGFFAGIFGIGGAVRGMFLSAFNLPKVMYIATAGAIGLMIDGMRIITYGAGDVVFPVRLWWGLLIFIPVSFAGAEIAKQIVDRIPQEKFRIIIASFLFIAGVKFLVFP